MTLTLRIAAPLASHDFRRVSCSQAVRQGGGTVRPALRADCEGRERELGRRDPGVEELVGAAQPPQPHRARQRSAREVRRVLALQPLRRRDMAAATAKAERAILVGHHQQPGGAGKHRLPGDRPGQCVHLLSAHAEVRRAVDSVWSHRAERVSVRALSPPLLCAALWMPCVE